MLGFLVLEDLCSCTLQHFNLGNRQSSLALSSLLTGWQTSVVVFCVDKWQGGVVLVSLYSVSSCDCKCSVVFGQGSPLLVLPGVCIVLVHSK